MEDKQKEVDFIMNKKFFLEKKEIACTFINIIIVKMFFTYPRIMVTNSGNAAWMQMLYVSLVCFGIFLIVDFLNRNNEMENIFDISEKVGGKILRIIIGSVILLVLLTNLSENIRIFPESIRTVILPNTPTKFIMFLFIGAISIGAYMGIYSICRIHSLFIPIIGLVMIFFFLVLLPDIDLNNIFPLSGTGVYNVFVKGLRGISVFSDMMIIYIILPFCKNRRDIKTSISYSFLISGIAAAVMLLIYVLVYPYPISREFILPAYQLARIAKIGSYFQRFEAFFEFAWSIAMMLYAAFYLFVICYTFTETFKTKYYTEVIMPIVLLSAGLGFVPMNFVTFLGDAEIAARIVYPILFLIPAGVGVIYSIKLKRRERRKKK